MQDLCSCRQMAHTACSFTYPSLMPSQDYNLSVYVWFWCATTDSNWSFQTVAKIAFQGGVGGLKLSNTCNNIYSKGSVYKR